MPFGSKKPKPGSNPYMGTPAGRIAARNSGVNPRKFGGPKPGLHRKKK